MIIYLNGYVTGQGYTLKKADLFSLTQKPEQEEISRKDLPQKEREIFLGSHAPLLFLGDGDQGRFGSVRNIPTSLRDENGRECFLNLAFSAVGEEARQVDALAWFAFCQRRRFQLFSESMVEYQDGDYTLNVGSFARLLKLAQSEAPASGFPAGKGLLVTEDGPESFFQDSGLGYSPDNFSQAISKQVWQRQGMDVELFFYCTAPATGFMLSQVDPVTGQVLGWESEVQRNMLPCAWNVMTNAGAKLAVFRQAGKLCMVVKDVKSAKAGPSGQAKHMSFVLQVKESQGLLARQMGAWALVDYPAFAQALTDCVQVSTIEYKVQGEKLLRLLDRFTEPIILPGTHPCRTVWQKVVNSALPFPLLTLDATLEYFCRSSGVPLTERQIGLVVALQQRDQMMQNPAALEFRPELYGILPVPAQAIQQAVPAAEPAVKEPEEKLKAAEPVEEPPKRENTAPQEGQRYPTASTQATRPLRAETMPEEDGIERVNLLQYKWFWPLAIGAVATLTAVILLGIYFGGRQG